MEFKEIQSVYLALAFLVPGFIASSVHCSFMTGRPYEGASAWLRFLTLSAVNYGLWSWLIYLLTTSPWFIQHQVVTAVCWAVIILVCPLFLGLLLAAAQQRGWITKVCGRLGLKLVHPIPTAWDWYFGGVKDGAWLLVRLKDGSQVAGWFGGSSFASSDPTSRDLVIERVYSVSDSGEWRPAPGGRGIFIAGSDICSVEFTPPEEGTPT